MERAPRFVFHVPRGFAGTEACFLFSPDRCSRKRLQSALIAFGIPPVPVNRCNCHSAPRNQLLLPSDRDCGVIDPGFAHGYRRGDGSYVIAIGDVSRGLFFRVALRILKSSVRFTVNHDVDGAFHCPGNGLFNIAADLVSLIYG